MELLFLQSLAQLRAPEKMHGGDADGHRHVGDRCHQLANFKADDCRTDEHGAAIEGREQRNGAVQRASPQQHLSVARRSQRAICSA